MLGVTGPTGPVSFSVSVEAWPSSGTGESTGSSSRRGLLLYQEISQAVKQKSMETGTPANIT